MKKLVFFSVSIALILLSACCNNNKCQKGVASEDTMLVEEPADTLLNDSTVADTLKADTLNTDTIKTKNN